MNIEVQKWKLLRVSREVIQVLN